MTLVLASQRKLFALARIHAELRLVVEGGSMPKLREAPCIPREPPYHGASYIGEIVTNFGAGSFVSVGDTLGLLGPLYPCWDEGFSRYFRDNFRGEDLPVWGILADGGKWISGTIALRGGRRDDDLECHHVTLVTSELIPASTDLHDLVESIRWIFLNEEFAETREAKSLLSYLDEILPITP